MVTRAFGEDSLSYDAIVEILYLKNRYRVSGGETIIPRVSELLFKALLPKNEKMLFFSDFEPLLENLKTEIEDKKLRKDLLYRLNVASLQLPSIKKRREDIPLIINYFIEKKEQELLKKIKLSDDVYALLQTIDWPGNVTQIKNFVEWLYILVKSSDKKIQIITPNMLPNDLLKETKDINSDEKNKSIMNLPIKDARKNFERQYLINQVNRFGGNISKTANFIGMERSALHRKIKGIGLKK